MQRMSRRERPGFKLGVVLCSLLTVGLFAGPASPHPSVARTSAPAKADPVLAARAARQPSAPFSVIVRKTTPTARAAERDVRSLGGRITHELPIVDGFSAMVPGSAVAALTRSSDVLRVWGDGRVNVNTVDMDQYDGYPINTVWTSSINLVGALTKAIGLGVGVAQID